MAGRVLPQVDEAGRAAVGPGGDDVLPVATADQGGVVDHLVAGGETVGPGLGLTVEFRRDAKAAPTVLTAPMQGLQYVGDAESATFAGNQIKIEAPGKRPVLCMKENAS